MSSESTVPTEQAPVEQQTPTPSTSEQEVAPKSASYNLYVKTLTGKTITLVVNDSEGPCTVESLKNKVQEQEG